MKHFIWIFIIATFVLSAYLLHDYIQDPYKQVSGAYSYNEGVLWHFNTDGTWIALRGENKSIQGGLGGNFVIDSSNITLTLEHFTAFHGIEPDLFNQNWGNLNGEPFIGDWSLNRGDKLMLKSGDSRAFIFKKIEKNKAEVLMKELSVEE